MLIFVSTNDLSTRIDQINEFISTGNDTANIKDTQKVPNEKTRVHRLIDSLKSVWKMTLSENDMKRLLWSYCSLLHDIIEKFDNIDIIVDSFCKKMCDTSTQEYAQVRTDVMRDLFISVIDQEQLCLSILSHLLLLAKELNCSIRWPLIIGDLIDQISNAKVNDKTKVDLLILLDEVYTQMGDTESSFLICQSLLGGRFNNFPDVKKIVLKCILTAVRDPNMFVLDQLLLLEPIKAIEGEPAHQLLSVFVSGDLQEYMKLYERFKDKFMEIDLDHDANIKKMRLLTFIKLADRIGEIDFDVLMKELLLNENEIEQFVIIAIKNKLISSLIDLEARKVIINQVTQRSLTRLHWKSVMEELKNWYSCLDDICVSFNGTHE